MRSSRRQSIASSVVWGMFNPLCNSNISSRRVVNVVEKPSHAATRWLILVSVGVREMESNDDLWVDVDV